MPIPRHEWTWLARPLNVVDGDTIDIEIDCGFHGRRTERLRLLNVNCPEVKRPTRDAGDAATQYTRDWMAALGTEDWPLVIVTGKSDAFGRYLALVWRSLDGRCLNEDLITEGHAVADIR